MFPIFSTIEESLPEYTVIFFSLFNLFLGQSAVAQATHESLVGEPYFYTNILIALLAWIPQVRCHGKAIIIILEAIFDIALMFLC